MPAALASHRSGLALPAITQGHALAGAAMTVWVFNAAQIQSRHAGRGLSLPADYQQ